MLPHLKQDLLSVALFAVLIGALFFAPSYESSIVVASEAYNLPAHEHHVESGETVIHHGIRVQSTPLILERDAWVNAIEVRIENAPYATLHHAALYEAGAPNPDCPAEDRILAGFASETPKNIRFPSPFGVYLKEGAVLYLEGMLHNPSPPQGPGGSYHDVRIQITLRTKEKEATLVPLQFRRVSLLDEPDCIRMRPPDTFTVPPHSPRFIRRSDLTRSEPNEEHVVFTNPGTIIGMGAHLHPWEGGKK